MCMSDTELLNGQDRAANVGLNPAVPAVEGFRSSGLGGGMLGTASGSGIARRLARKAHGIHGPLGMPAMAYGLSSYNMAPALKAINLSPVDSFTEGAGSLASQLSADHSAPAAGEAVQRKSAGDLADEGFRGAAHEIPHRQEMERSFGMDFGHVQAYSDANASRANDSLNAHAYTVGNQVAFKTASPDPALVAHELTHVVQHGGMQAKSAGDGIDTSGEAEAEAVESAVAAGRPASSALKSVGSHSGPAFKKAEVARKPGVARNEGGGGGSNFGMGLQFSMEGFEKSYTYTLWKGHYAWPIGIPGVNFVIDPNVKVGLAGGAKWGGEEKGSLYAQLGITGECGIGLSGGIPDVAEVYGTINPTLEGVFKLTKMGNPSGGGEGHAQQQAQGHGNAPAQAQGQQAPAGPAASTWSLEGYIGLKASAKIGVSLAGGIVDQSFELGSIEIGKLTGIYFDQNGFRRDKVGWQWGEKIKQAFEAIKSAIEKAKNLGKAAIQGMKNAGHAIAQGARDAWHWVTSW